MMMIMMKHAIKTADSKLSLYRPRLDGL